MTREEFIKLMCSAFVKETKTSDVTFSDTDLNAWYMPYIRTAYAEGITSGMGDGSFGTGLNITRQDMAVMIFNTLTMMEKSFVAKDNSEAFSDIQNVSDYAKNAVNELKKYALISGRGNNMYCPMETLTRAEAATIIYRVLTF